ncbi:MAG: hypothetical protein SGILL_000746 [Bacillariaceae sp.]
MKTATLIPLFGFATLSLVGGQEEATCNAPAPFDASAAPSDVYIILGVSTGGFFQDLLSGMMTQAPFIGESGVNPVIMEAENGDFAEMATFVTEAAQNKKTVGIVTVDGSQESMCGAIQEAIETHNVSVVSFDFKGGACVTGKHVLTAQADDDMASFVLQQAQDQHPGNGIQVGYVSDLNFEPLINRDVVWNSFKFANGWEQAFFVENPANFSALEDLVEAIAAELEENPQVDFIYAPWDYLAGAALSALEIVNDTTTDSVYGADINDEDIALMIADGSLWKATAGADPKAIGASLMRMVALSATGDLASSDIVIPTTLITQEFLLDNQVSSMETMRAAMPEIQLDDFVEACWMKATFDNETSSGVSRGWDCLDPWTMMSITLGAIASLRLL